MKRQVRSQAHQLEVQREELSRRSVYTDNHRNDPFADPEIAFQDDLLELSDTMARTGIVPGRQSSSISSSSTLRPDSNLSSDLSTRGIEVASRDGPRLRRTLRRTQARIAAVPVTSRPDQRETDLQAQAHEMPPPRREKFAVTGAYEVETPEIQQVSDVSSNTNTSDGGKPNPSIDVSYNINTSDGGNPNPSILDVSHNTNTSNGGNPNPSIYTQSFQGLHIPHTNSNSNSNSNSQSVSSTIRNRKGIESVPAILDKTLDYSVVSLAFVNNHDHDIVPLDKNEPEFHVSRGDGQKTASIGQVSRTTAGRFSRWGQNHSEFAAMCSKRG